MATIRKTDDAIKGIRSFEKALRSEISETTSRLHEMDIEKYNALMKPDGKVDIDYSSKYNGWGIKDDVRDNTYLKAAELAKEKNLGSEMVLAGARKGIMAVIGCHALNIHLEIVSNGLPKRRSIANVEEVINTCRRDAINDVAHISEAFGISTEEISGLFVNTVNKPQNQRNYIDDRIRLGAAFMVDDFKPDPETGKELRDSAFNDLYMDMGRLWPAAMLMQGSDPVRLKLVASVYYQDTLHRARYPEDLREALLAATKAGLPDEMIQAVGQRLMQAYDNQKGIVTKLDTAMEFRIGTEADRKQMALNAYCYLTRRDPETQEVIQPHLLFKAADIAKRFELGEEKVRNSAVGYITNNLTNPGMMFPLREAFFGGICTKRIEDTKQKFGISDEEVTRIATAHFDLLMDSNRKEPDLNKITLAVSIAVFIGDKNMINRAARTGIKELIKRGNLTTAKEWAESRYLKNDGSTGVLGQWHVIASAIERMHVSVINGTSSSAPNPMKLLPKDEALKLLNRLFRMLIKQGRNVEAISFAKDYNLLGNDLGLSPQTSRNLETLLELKKAVRAT